jgi:hypothetical protein
MQSYALCAPRTQLKLAVWMAWRRYLLTVQASSRATYEVVEESAWKRLAEELSGAGASIFRQSG